MAGSMLQVHFAEVWARRSKTITRRLRIFINVMKGLAWVLAMTAVIQTLLQLLGRPQVPLALFAALTLMFGVAVYVLLAENFLQWAGALLNRSRKGKWIKELEYPYMFLGTAGLYVAINRMEIMEGASRNLDLWGPLLIAAAIAVKLIKVRAETNDWDKL